MGLAAGFDKDANLMRIIPAVGFGFEEVGSVTALPCKGNPKPRIWRLPKHGSLVVNYGLKNCGCKAIVRKLRGKRNEIPIGINIARTNCRDVSSEEEGIGDYFESLKTLEPYASYVTINISCPNAFGGQFFTDPILLEKLLAKLMTIGTDKPIYIKLSPDLLLEQVDVIISVCEKYSIGGFIISNLLKNREGSGIHQGGFAKVGQGGLSGKPVERNSNQMISHVYQRTGGKYTIIGCGGIFSAKDAYEKIRCGASLVQLITGMIFEGPLLIGRINRGLVRLLRRDGFNDISQAVGTKHRK